MLARRCKVESENECEENYFKLVLKFPSSLKPDVILIGEHDKQSRRFSERQKEINKVIEELGGAKASEIKEKLTEEIPSRTLRFDLGVLEKLGIITSKGRGASSIWYKV